MSCKGAKRAKISEIFFCVADFASLREIYKNYLAKAQRAQRFLKYFYALHLCERFTDAVYG